MSGDKTTTQRSQSEPWDAAQPLLKSVLGDAQDLYNSGVGFQPYTGSTVVPFADQTVAGMDDVTSRATAAMGGNSAMDKGLNFLGGLYDTGGLSGDQQSIADMWRNVAGGGDLNTVSPTFNNVMKQAQDAARDNVNLSMSAGGRYGSGVHTDVLGKTVGDLTDRMLSEEYDRQLGRMDTARTNLANLGQQGITNMFGATEATPAAYEATKTPAKDLMTVGSMYEDLAGRTMADNQRIFNETQQSPLRALEWLNAIGSGAGSLGGSSSGSTTQPGTNPFLQIAAGLLGGGNLLFGGA